MVNRAVKYRLYPTAEQAAMFSKTFGCCRKIWNLMLSDKIDSYNATGQFCAVTPAKYKPDYPYLREADSLALCSVWKNLQQAFKNCFDKSRKKCCGFPKFKSAKHSRKSYTTNNQHGTVAVAGGFIKLPKIGLVKAVIHREPADDWVIKSVTVSQDSDGKYYASVLFESDAAVVAHTPDFSNAVGLDYSSEHLYVDSNGSKGTKHKYYCESRAKLAGAQRRLSRMTGSRKGEAKSCNYIKQLKRVNKIHCHIANQRRDRLHKLSTEIANQYDIVCVESLNMSAMSNKGFGNGRATLDNGYGMFLTMLAYKLTDRGKQFIKVDKWFPSSQLCSACGKRHAYMRDLSVRIMQCDCGMTMDRDRNAAVNILNEGLRLLREQLATV